MTFQAGTTFTITDGLNLAVVLLTTEKHKLAGEQMQGVWGLHRSSTGQIGSCRRGSWKLTFMALYGIGHSLSLYDERGKPVLIISAEGDAANQGNGMLYGPVGKPLMKLKGYPNLPLCDASKLWFGFAFKMGGQLGLGGADISLGALVNVGTRETACVELQSFKGGLGLGASLGFTGILALNYPTAQSMNGATNDGFDFALSLGGRWDGILKNLQNAPKYTKLLSSLPKVCKTMGEASAIAKRLQQLENLSNWAKILAAFTCLPTADSAYAVFDIPGAGTGLEVGVSYGVTTIINVDGLDAPSGPTAPVGKMGKPLPNYKEYNGVGRRNF